MNETAKVLSEEGRWEEGKRATHLTSVRPQVLRAAAMACVHVKAASAVHRQIYICVHAEPILQYHLLLTLSSNREFITVFFIYPKRS